VIGGGALDRVLLLPLRRPRLVLAFVAALTLLAAWLWPRVAFQPDITAMLPRSHPEVQIAALLQDEARPARTLWLLLRGEQAIERAPTVAAALRRSPRLAEVAATRSELFGAALAAARQAPLWQLSDTQMAALQQALTPAGLAATAADRLAELTEDAIAGGELLRRDPLGLRFLLAGDDLATRLRLAPGAELAAFADGSVLLRLVGTTDAYDAEFATAVVAEVERVLGDAPYELFGGYAVAAADQARIRADFTRASTVSALAIAVYLMWVMRGVRLPLLVQLPAALSVVWAIPFAAALLGPLPTVAVAAVAVLGGLGVDFAIHYAARYRAARLGSDHRTAAAAVQRATVPELLIDMATTAVTFVAIGGGQLSGIGSFGWLLALGLVASVLLTTTALPILLRFAGQRVDPERSWLAALADRWLGSRASKPLAWFAVLLGLLGAVFVSWRGVPLSADGERLRPAADPVAAARARIEQSVGFATVPTVVLWPLATEPSPLWQALAALQEKGEVRFWSGLDRAGTAVGRAAVARCRAAIVGFEARAAAAFTVVGLAAAPLAPTFEELAARFAADPAEASPPTIVHAGVVSRVVQVWSARRLDVGGIEALASELAGRGAAGAVVHGPATVATALVDVLRSDLQRACWLALALASLLVTCWLRSPRLGLLALVPSGLGLIAMLTALHALSLPLSLVSFVAVPFVLGIGIDEGVHLVGHFRGHLRGHFRGHGGTGAPPATTGATGVGIVRTSIGTALGFGALLAAASPGLVELGALVAGGAIASMFACLFVLAPLLRRGG
jgi:uncharacterized protein